MKHFAKIIWTICILFVAGPILSPASASISGCTASVDRPQVTTGSTLDYTITVKNDSPDTDILWVRVTRPPSNFSISSAQSGSWNGVAAPPETATYTGSGLVPGNSYPFGFTAVAGDIAPSANWTVEVSDKSDGTSPTTCGGSPGTEIVAAAPAPPTISNIVVSGISDSQAIISWTTDTNSNSIINYGTTTDYGTTKSDSSMTTSHSLTITGLTANTTYHYDVSSTDGLGNGSDAGDNTFVTAMAGSTTTTSTTGTVTTVTGTPTPTPRPDTKPPKVTVVADFSKPFKVAPTVTGTATDQSGVASLEYSFDNGKSWLPVDTISDPGKKSTTFAFTPESLLDDNYQVKIRATDILGNKGETPVGTLVIDRLPPRMGGTVASLGPQVLSPSPDGSYVVPVGLDVKLTLSVVGGPTTIDVSYVSSTGDSRLVHLTKNPDNGLWSGVLRFDATGTYNLSAHAVDGAGNRGERDIATFMAVKSGRVTGGDQPVRNARLTVYYLDAMMKQFVVWDGSSYGQVNPQTLTQDGQYMLYLPPGTYYLNVKAPGYRSLVTNMFTLPQAAPVTTNFSLVRARAIRLFSFVIPLPDFRLTTATVNVPVSSRGQMVSPLVGHEFPYFHLSTGAKAITSFDLRGKPTIITFLNTWLPVATTQMAVLRDVAKKKDINVLVVIPQETASSVYVFAQRGAYNIPIAADPDGDLVDPLNLHSLPTHVVVDRKGIITAVQSGVFNKDELFDMIIQ